MMMFSGFIRGGRCFFDYQIPPGQQERIQVEKEKEKTKLTYVLLFITVSLFCTSFSASQYSFMFFL